MMSAPQQTFVALPRRERGYSTLKAGQFSQRSLIATLTTIALHNSRPTSWTSPPSHLNL